MARPLAHRIGIDTIKIAHRGGGNPQLMLSAKSLIGLDVLTEAPKLAATLARSRLLTSLKVAERLTDSQPMVLSQTPTLPR